MSYGLLINDLEVSGRGTCTCSVYCIQYEHTCILDDLFTAFTCGLQLFVYNFV